MDGAPALKMSSASLAEWLALLLFCVFSFSNAIQWVTYASIASAVRDFFGLSTSELNLLSSVYMIVFAIGALLTCTTFERWGVRTGVLVGCTLNALGSVLKFAPGLQYPRYATLMVPQILNALAQLFVLSTPPLLAAYYFAPHQRAFATAIASTSNNLGNAVALFVPPLIVQVGTHDEFVLLFALQIGMCVVVCLGVVVAFRAPDARRMLGSAALLDEHEPAADATATSPHEQCMEQEQVQGHDHPPQQQGQVGGRVRDNKDMAAHGGVCSCAAAEAALTCRQRDGQGDDVAMRASASSTSQPPSLPRRVWRSVQGNEDVKAVVDVLRAMGTLVRCRDFVFLLCAFSISMGSVWTFASVLAQIFEPFGISAQLAGVAGALNVVVGTCAAYVVGWWVDRRHRFKTPLIVCLSGSVLCCFALLMVLWRAPASSRTMDAAAVTVYVLAGTFQNTAVPLSFEFAMELTYPMMESVPSTLLMAGANVVSLVLLSVSSLLLGDGVASPRACVYVLVLLTSVCGVGVVLAALPREQLRRRAAVLHARVGSAPADDAAAAATASPHDSADELDVADDAVSSSWAVLSHANSSAVVATAAAVTVTGLTKA